ncbi:unnamed protein product [Somion occarium]|uniref:C2H2-type domain-containing protein n=1 Tax=Somion occarium TaxID=3059160 RepID=A0ABP1EBE4_9APHY
MQTTNDSRRVDRQKRWGVIIGDHETPLTSLDLGLYSVDVDEEVRAFFSSDVESGPRPTPAQGQVVEPSAPLARKSLTRKPLPPLPVEECLNTSLLPTTTAVSQVHSPHAILRTPRHSSEGDTVQRVGSPDTLLCTPESETLTLVDDEAQWLMIDADFKSDTNGRTDDIIEMRKSIARWEACCVMREIGRTRNLDCPRDGCHHVLADYRSLTAHLVMHDMDEDDGYHKERVIFKCLTSGCNRVFLHKDEMLEHKEHCGWAVRSVAHKPTSHIFVSGVKRSFSQFKQSLLSRKK